jgi:WD40 repeat protein
MFCTNCGQRLNDDARFCSGCGKPLNQAGNDSVGQVTKPAEEETESEEKKQSFSSKLGLEKKDDGGQEQNKPLVSADAIPDTIEDSIEVSSAAISLDGKYLAMRIEEEEEDSSEYELQIMDTSSGKIVHSIDWNDEWDGGLSSCIEAVSNDGIYAAIPSSSYWYVLNVKTGNVIEKNGHISPGPAAFSGDCKKLAYVPERNRECLYVISLPKGNELFSIEGEYFKFLAYSPDGRYLATNSFKGIIIWDGRTGSKLHTLSDSDDSSSVLSIPKLFGGKGRVDSSIAFSHDGKRIVTASGEKVIKIWDVKTGNLLLQFGKPQGNSKSFVRFSPNDKAIVACYYDDGQIQIINSETGEILHQLNGGKYIKWASYSSDGKKLISYSGDSVKIWGNE